MAQNRAQNKVFCYFFKFSSLGFLERCLDKRGQNWGRNDLFYFHVVERLLKLAYLFCYCEKLPISPF